MQFIYAKDAGTQSLVLNVKEYSHIFKVRRVKSDTKLHLRNLDDSNLYTYSISQITKKEAILDLEQTQELIIEPQKFLHVGWSIVDTKIVEKNIAMLNEIGVSKITFLYADYSQKHFKIDMQRLERILHNSCEQCGRSSMIQIEFLESVDSFLEMYSNTAIIDFSSQNLSQDCAKQSFLIGPEGGFSARERKIFEKFEIYGLNSPMILRSESAVVSVCAKILL